MAWRKQRQKRQQKCENAATAVRSSPWASSSMKNNMYISSTDTRLQMAQMAQGEREKKLERRKKANANHRRSKPPVDVSRRNNQISSRKDLDDHGNKREAFYHHSQGNSNRGIPNDESNQPLAPSPNVRNFEDDFGIDFVGSAPNVDSSHWKSSKESRPKTRSKNRPKIPANYFACVRVDDVELVSKIRDFQCKLEAQRPELKRFFIDTAGLHVTVCVFAIDGPHEMKKIRLALSNASKLLIRSLHSQPLQLAIDGIGTFGNRVLFGKVQHGQLYLEALRKSIVAEAKFIGCIDSIVDPDKPFVAHATFAKMNHGQNGIRDIELSKLDIVKDAFGFQTCKELLLCPIGSSNPGEFYTVEMRARIASEEKERNRGSTPTTSKKELQSVLDFAIQQNNLQRKRHQRSRRFRF
mmetsp:Transcript_3925/g.7520  ORF Transcript_3925/g.7520 Transcript_3925/m.7520 type:complete len:410 (-) Transcript_3925:94-1323(-)